MLHAESSLLRALMETNDTIAARHSKNALNQVMSMLDREQSLFVGNSFPGFVSVLDSNDDEV